MDRYRYIVVSCLTVFLSIRCLAESARPYPDSELIGGIRFDWSTHQRAAQGSDNFQLTWADDNHLYGAWGDGGGFGGTNSRGRVGLGVARIEGSAQRFQGFNVWGGHAAESPASFDGKSWGMLSLSGTLYMWVVPDVPSGKAHRNHYEYVELARSIDRGKSWLRAPWRFEQHEDLTVPTFLNFGQDYGGVPNEVRGYVYSYFIAPQSLTMEQAGPDAVGLKVHKPGRIYLARVRVESVMAGKSSYEFFSGVEPGGRVRWGAIREKKPVFQDANGVGWCLSVSYHPILKRYILCTEHGESSQGTLGFFDAPHPWGPWTTIEYFTNSKPFGAERASSPLPWRNNVFFASFPTKWIHGQRFTLTFTGAGRGKDNDSFNTVEGWYEQR